jgi:DNA-binding NarL/FixJ family response regulator
MIVDDHPLVREGLTRLISAQPDMCVCGEASTASEAWQKLEVANPDVIIVDLSLPGQNGLDLIKDLHARHPDLPLLVLSMHEETLYAERVLRAGARGFLMKGEPIAKIIDALQVVLSGNLYMSQKISGGLLQTVLHTRHAAAASPTSPLKRLSDREIEIFEGIGNSLSTRDLGQKLGISPKTVETHRSHIRSKLGLANNNDLIHAAIRWVESETGGRPGDAGQMVVG